MPKHAKNTPMYILCLPLIQGSWCLHKTLTGVFYYLNMANTFTRVPADAIYLFDRRRLPWSPYNLFMNMTWQKQSRLCGLQSKPYSNTFKVMMFSNFNWDLCICMCRTQVHFTRQYICDRFTTIYIPIDSETTIHEWLNQMFSHCCNTGIKIHLRPWKIHKWSPWDWLQKQERKENL